MYDFSFPLFIITVFFLSFDHYVFSSFLFNITVFLSLFLLLRFLSLFLSLQFLLVPVMPELLHLPYQSRFPLIYFYRIGEYILCHFVTFSHHCDHSCSLLLLCMSFECNYCIIHDKKKLFPSFSKSLWNAGIIMQPKLSNLEPGYHIAHLNNAIFFLIFFFYIYNL